MPTNQFHRTTMTALHQRLCERMLYGPDYDYVTGMDCILEHVWAEADSMQWDCDISRFWLPQSRWTRMQNQYLDRETTLTWLNQIEKRVRKKAANRDILRTKLVQGRHHGNATIRALGNCMLSLSFSLQTTPTILLHSRTGYLGYLSPLDWSIAYHCGRLAAERIGLDIKDFRFIWFADTIQYHKFRTIAFPLGAKSEREYFIERCRSASTTKSIAMQRNWREYCKWAKADKQGLTYDELSNYRSSQRPRKRFHSQVKGYDYALRFADPGNKPFTVLPSIDVKDLRLDKVGLE